MTSAPLTLRLPTPDACRPSWLAARVQRVARSHRTAPRPLIARFALKCDEGRFARRLLERAPQHWVFRTQQGRGCGDFVVVDMSSPDPARRRAWALDLKLGGLVRERVGIQLGRIDRATRELRAQEVIGYRVEPKCLYGDGARLHEVIVG